MSKPTKVDIDNALNSMAESDWNVDDFIEYLREMSPNDYRKYYGQADIDEFEAALRNQLDSRFYTQPLDGDNVIDMNLSADKLVGIVDEKQGGIIAYAIGQENAELIVKGLSK